MTRLVKLMDTFASSHFHKARPLHAVSTTHAHVAPQARCTALPSLPPRQPRCSTACSAGRLYQRLKNWYTTVCLYSSPGRSTTAGAGASAPAAGVAGQRARRAEALPSLRGSAAAGSKSSRQGPLRCPASMRLALLEQTDSLPERPAPGPAGANAAQNRRRGSPVGKPGVFTALGKPCVSRHSPACLGYAAPPLPRRLPSVWGVGWVGLGGGRVGGRGGEWGPG